MLSSLSPPGTQRSLLPLLALLIGSVIVAGACGSTERQVTAYSVDEEGSDGRDSWDDGSGSGERESGADDGAAGGGTAGRGTAGRNPSSQGPGRTSGSLRSGGTDTSPDDGGGSSNGLGVTDTAIRIGIVVFVNTDEMTKQVAPSLGLFGDFKAYYRIAVDRINATGGVLGRKLEPVFRDYDSNRSDTAVQAQANCDALTHDTKVFAVLMPGRQNDTFRSCLERAGVVHMAMGGATGVDERTFTQFRHYSEAGTLNLSRLAAQQVDHLVAEGFLTADSVIGVVTYDETSYKRAVERHLKPALARHSLRAAEILAAPYAENSSETGATSAAIQTGVVQFDTAGVDRVLFVQNGVTLPLLFMTRAGSQGYRPRYAVNSSEAPSSLADTVQPSSQLEGAVGIGWLPPSDVDEADDTVTTQQKACTDTMTAAGQLPRGRSYAAAMYAVCDHVDVFVQALRNGGRPDRKAFVTGLEAITDYKAAITFGLQYGPGRHDGVAAVRVVKFFSECRCFRYTSTLKPL